MPSLPEMLVGKTLPVKMRYVGLDPVITVLSVDWDLKYHMMVNYDGTPYYYYWQHTPHHLNWSYYHDPVDYFTPPQSEEEPECSCKNWDLFHYGCQCRWRSWKIRQKEKEAENARDRPL